MATERPFESERMADLGETAASAPEERMVIGRATRKSRDHARKEKKQR
jgi:hypothetical protein